MPLMPMLVTSIAIGIAAQKMKGRTGAAWWFVSGLAMAILYPVIYFPTAMARPDLYATDVGFVSLAIMVSLIVGVPAAVIILTLPGGKKEKP